MIRRHVVVHGFVQGVGFRYSCAHEAGRLGVAGWVRNLDDGDVELVAEGPAEAVEELLAWVRAGGPRFAEVTRVDVTEEQPRGARGFDVAF